MDKWMLRLIGLIIGVASPELRKMLAELLNQAEEKAKATKNPWDDILVGLLKRLLLGEDKPFT